MGHCMLAEGVSAHDRHVQKHANRMLSPCKSVLYIGVTWSAWVSHSALVIHCRGIKGACNLC